MKALIKIAKASKFTPQDLDIFRRVLNVLQAHDLSANLEIKTKVVHALNSRLKVV